MMREVSVNELLELSVAELPPVKRFVMRLRLQNKRYATRLAAELADKMADDAECCNMAPGFVAMANSEAFSLDAKFAIDIEQLSKLIELILKWLPAIIALFSTPV